MAALSRRNQNRADIWPGFVDALATLLMVIIFLLMIFVIAQSFLNDALSGRDQALDRLRNQVSELADLLSLERGANTDLRGQVATLSDDLQASVGLQDDLSLQLSSMLARAEAAEDRANSAEFQVKTAAAEAIRLKADAAAEAAGLKTELLGALKSVDGGKQIIQDQLIKIAALANSIEALKALREELEAKVKSMLGKLSNKDEQIITEKKLSDTARAQVALLNSQIRKLRQQIAGIARILDASEKRSSKQRVRIANLGKRLNAALASKVQELSRYRSEFFGELRKILGNQPGIRIVGDRFVFQSEVLFTTGSDEMGAEGQAQIRQLATTLKNIADKIPKTINWVLRVDGHTDKIPINTARFPSNWELSTARAISVVKFLTQHGIPPTNLAATGFGEFQPIDPRDDEIANRRNRRIELKLTQR